MHILRNSRTLKRVFCGLIIGISIVSSMMLSGCSGSNSDNNTLKTSSTEPTQQTASLNLDDMFGDITSPDGIGPIKAAAIQLNSDIYVFAEFNGELTAQAEYNYRTIKTDKSIALKPPTKTPEGLYAFKAMGDDLNIPSVERTDQQKVKLCYLSGTEIQQTDINSGNDPIDITSVSLPALLIYDDKCAGLVRSTGEIYYPQLKDILMITEAKPEIRSDKDPSELPAAQETEQATLTATDTPADSDKGNQIYLPVIIGCLVIFALCFIWYRLKHNAKKVDADTIVSYGSKNPTHMQAKTTTVGTVHNIGKRSAQQDSLGMTDTSFGMLAAVADGMGGLADGDKVSQSVIKTLLEASASLKQMTQKNVLFEITSAANRRINEMLGERGRATSGSTLVAVLMGNGYFHWVSVGDSRIYLYHERCLLQLNREHNYEMDLIEKAINGEISFSDIQTNPQRHGLTSFIGMGRLAHVDGSVRPIKLSSQDKLLLMSDGVYNTLSENEIISILSGSENAELAASKMERSILEHKMPKQDNFTAIIIDIG